MLLEKNPTEKNKLIVLVSEEDYAYLVEIGFGDEQEDGESDYTYGSDENVSDVREMNDDDEGENVNEE